MNTYMYKSLKNDVFFSLIVRRGIQYLQYSHMMKRKVYSVRHLLMLQEY